MQQPAIMQSEFDDAQTYKIIGAAMAVHRELGCGFLEAVSGEAFAIELGERSIPFVLRGTDRRPLSPGTSRDSAAS